MIIVHNQKEILADSDWLKVEPHAVVFTRGVTRAGENTRMGSNPPGINFPFKTNILRLVLFRGATIDRLFLDRNTPL